MKVLVTGDTHMNLGHCMYLVRRAQEHDCDRMFIVGDFGYWEHTRDGQEFLDELDTYAIDQSIPVYFLDGNHDKTSLLLEKYQDQVDGEGFLLVRPNLRYAPRGHRWTWDKCRFIALGGAYSVDKGWRIQMEREHPKYGGPESLWFPEEEMTDDDMAKILVNASPVDIILAHDKPRGSNPGWNRKNLLECQPNQDRLQRAVEVLDPQFFIHGHLHWHYRQDLWHSNNGVVEDVRITKVIGLDCDGNAGGDKEKSWTVLDTEVVTGAR